MKLVNILKRQAVSTMQNLNDILAKVDLYKPSKFNSEKCDEIQIKKIRNSIDLIAEAGKHKKATILFRGTKLQILKPKLVSKLNSNNSLLDGLFLVGDKAKNYLKKEDEIPHPIKVINSTGQNAADWIFDEYKLLNSEIIGTDYFKNSANRSQFAKSIKGNVFFMDYYLKGLHTWNSDFLVNFVSATPSLNVASSNGNDLVIMLWMSKIYSKHVLVSSALKNQENGLNEKMLPVIKTLFKEEEEYSFKGFILPHYIIGVYLESENKIIINPLLLDNNNPNWIQDGFEIDNKKFIDFIKTTKYQRFLTLYDNEKFEENNVC